MQNKRGSCFLLTIEMIREPMRGREKIDKFHLPWGENKFNWQVEK